jgi:hypothetical protein
MFPTESQNCMYYYSSFSVVCNKEDIFLCVASRDRNYVIVLDVLT